MAQRMHFFIVIGLSSISHAGNMILGVEGDCKPLGVRAKSQGAFSALAQEPNWQRRKQGFLELQQSYNLPRLQPILQCMRQRQLENTISDLGLSCRIDVG